MVWFFERESTTIRCEIRRETEGPAFEVVLASGADEKVERIDSPAILLRRSQAVWAGLMAEGWRPRPGASPHH